MVIALAGRRIDAPDASQKRFPNENAERVRQEISDLLKRAEATVVVCAAACGTDILALEAARELGLRRRIVLPYGRDAFKKSSVSDRSGDWGDRYDRIIAEVESKGDLLEYDYGQVEEETYFATNHDILDEAEDIAEQTGGQLVALVVWNGESRGDEDVTEHFLREAKNREIEVVEISTL
jgi:hypothetical protein